MAIQSANATVLRVTRIATLSISQLYFASIRFSFKSGLRPARPVGHRFSFYGHIRASGEKVPLNRSDMLRSTETVDQGLDNGDDSEVLRLWDYGKSLRLKRVLKSRRSGFLAA